jgi:type II secretory pathway component PulK
MQLWVLLVLLLVLLLLDAIVGDVAWSFCCQSRSFLLRFLAFQAQWMQRRKAM